MPPGHVRARIHRTGTARHAAGLWNKWLRANDPSLPLRRLGCLPACPSALVVTAWTMAGNRVTSTSIHELAMTSPPDYTTTSHAHFRIVYYGLLLQGQKSPFQILPPNFAGARDRARTGREASSPHTAINRVIIRAPAAVAADRQMGWSQAALLCYTRTTRPSCHRPTVRVRES